MVHMLLPLGVAAPSLLAPAAAAPAAPAAPAEVYAVTELTFTGPTFGPADAPARDVDFRVRFRHASGGLEHVVHGFWDGDGRGGASGSVFRVRFCPTAPGRWLLAEVASNRAELRGQRQGEWIEAAPSPHPGFWLVDPESPGRRWYRRSDGSHPYVLGNTMYSFVSGIDDRGPNGSSIAADVRANAGYFRKLRFGIHGDRYPRPEERPFLDDAGRPSDAGRFSHRPNPAWFAQRVDVAVQTAFAVDCIADIILNGPDTADSRSILRAEGNGGDAAPFLRYIAARYGSYPNVWICVSNEWDIKKPQYSAEQVRGFGAALRGFLPYPTPVSIHGVRDWHAEVNATPSWNDHVILQNKVKSIAKAADGIVRNHALGGGDRPVINDELAYEGAGDGFTPEDVVEAHLGAFLGGGYATTGHKPANKKGHYFWGAFKPEEHEAADNLKWLRERIEAEVTFWKMAPVPADSVFAHLTEGSRAMAWPGREYVLGTDASAAGIQARLPDGAWEVKRFDALALEEKTLALDARGVFTFDAPASRAVLFLVRRR